MSVTKSIQDIMEGAFVGRKISNKSAKKAQNQAASNPVIEEIRQYRQNHAAITPQEFTKLLKKWDAKMYEHARNLEFEQAAMIRDEIKELKESAFKEDL